MAKEAVNYSYEGGLRSGLNYEKRLFYSNFATVRLALHFVSMLIPG